MIKNAVITNRAIDEFDQARGRMAGDFKTMIADSEELLKAAATLSGEGFAAARAKFEEKLRSAKTRLADASQPMLDKTRETAAAADEYVRGNPWTTAGIALAAGVLIGSLAAKR
jgi:ElaB/YqjD/DUF883 family membrane-anchored ribosome-binding protein